MELLYYSYSKEDFKTFKKNNDDDSYDNII